MNSKKIIKIFNVLFIISMLINVFCTASFATENVIQTSDDIVIVKECDRRYHTIISVIQIILNLLMLISWGLAIYKLIRKDRKENIKKIIILVISGMILGYVSGILSMFKCM